MLSARFFVVEEDLVVHVTLDDSETGRSKLQFSRGRRGFIIRVTITCVVLWLGLKTHQRLVASPRLEIDAEIVEINAKTQTGSVSIRNVGDSELRILKLAASCECATARVEDTTLSPGENTLLTATLNGKTEAVIAIITNEPDSEAKLITVQSLATD